MFHETLQYFLVYYFASVPNKKNQENKRYFQDNCIRVKMLCFYYLEKYCDYSILFVLLYRLYVQIVLNGNN